MPSANIFELLTQATVSSPSLISSLLKWYCTPHALFDANSLPSSSALCSSCYTHAERSRSAVSRTIWMINLRVQTASLATRPRAIYLAPIVNLGSVICFLRFPSCIAWLFLPRAESLSRMDIMLAELSNCKGDCWPCATREIEQLGWAPSPRNHQFRTCRWRNRPLSFILPSAPHKNLPDP